MTTRNSDEAKDEYVRVMGQELGTQFAALWQEVVSLHLKWGEYCELFAEKAERVTMLNRAAQVFFHLIQDMLWKELLLHIARLTDVPKTSGNKNLTIQNFLSLVADPALRSAVQLLLKETAAKTKFCRDWRNRHIAHQDLDLTINENAKRLEMANRQFVREALGMISATMNEIQAYFNMGETWYRGITSAGGALSLLYVIDDGLKARAEREARLVRGEWTPEDARRQI